MAPAAGAAPAAAGAAPGGPQVNFLPTLKIDKDQYDTREGPCLQALASQEVVSVPNVAEDPRWPNFRDAASKEGLGSVLSLPLSVRERGAGALNLYSRSVGAFGDRSRSVALLFASQASAALSNAQVYAASLRELKRR